MPTPTPFASEEEINLLARMIYSEQPSQGDEVMRRTAWIAVNRVATTYSGADSLTDVLTSGEFFVRTQDDIDSRIRDNPLEAAEWERAQEIARQVVEEYEANGATSDPTEGAIFFANVRRVGETTDEYREAYEELLEEAGVTDYTVLPGGREGVWRTWFFYNATSPVRVPPDLQP